jgi:tRNA G18 (ribose-2'-O)-methylase SpoU/8-oxo-dGTP pyrophosphatase MutT (NUDIX family)
MSENELIQLIDPVTLTNRDVILPRSQVHPSQALDDPLKGPWHMVIHVLIIDRNTGSLLVQKRSSSKRLYPSEIDVSVGGHIDPGESPIGGALRETREELGMDVDPSSLRFRGYIVLAPEYEISSVYSYYVSGQVDVSSDIDHTEVESVFWLRLRESLNHKLVARFRTIIEFEILLLTVHPFSSTWNPFTLVSMHVPYCTTLHANGVRLAEFSDVAYSELLLAHLHDAYNMRPLPVQLLKYKIDCMDEEALWASSSEWTTDIIVRVIAPYYIRRKGVISRTFLPLLDLRRAILLHEVLPYPNDLCTEESLIDLHQQDPRGSIVLAQKQGLVSEAFVTIYTNLDASKEDTIRPLLPLLTEELPSFRSLLIRKALSHDSVTIRRCCFFAFCTAKFIIPAEYFFSEGIIRTEDSLSRLVSYFSDDRICRSVLISCLEYAAQHACPRLPFAMLMAVLRRLPSCVVAFASPQLRERVFARVPFQPSWMRNLYANALQVTDLSTASEDHLQMNCETIASLRALDDTSSYSNDDIVSILVDTNVLRRLLDAFPARELFVALLRAVNVRKSNLLILRMLLIIRFGPLFAADLDDSRHVQFIVTFLRKLTATKRNPRRIKEVKQQVGSVLPHTLHRACWELLLLTMENSLFAALLVSHLNSPAILLAFAAFDHGCFANSCDVRDLAEVRHIVDGAYVDSFGGTFPSDTFVLEDHVFSASLFSRLGKVDTDTFMRYFCPSIFDPRSDSCEYLLVLPFFVHALLGCDVSQRAELLASIVRVSHHNLQQQERAVLRQIWITFLYDDQSSIAWSLLVSELENPSNVSLPSYIIALTTAGVTASAMRKKLDPKFFTTIGGLCGSQHAGTRHCAQLSVLRLAVEGLIPADDVMLVHLHGWLTRSMREELILETLSSFYPTATPLLGSTVDRLSSSGLNDAVLLYASTIFSTRACPTGISIVSSELRSLLSTIRPVPRQLTWFLWTDNLSPYVQHQDQDDGKADLRSHGSEQHVHTVQTKHGVRPNAFVDHAERLPLVVCSSFVEKLPNIAGIFRTAECFSLEAIAIHEPYILKSAEFKACSVSSERWQPYIHVPLTDVTTWCRSMKDQGYSIIALEQSSDSVAMHTFVWPRKTVLVLGNEIQGLPLEIFASGIIDSCVEIPQSGIIRSLNVHVSAAMAVWEYVRQQLPIGGHP